MCKWPFILRWWIYCNETCFIGIYRGVSPGVISTLFLHLFRWLLVSYFGCGLFSVAILGWLHSCCHDFECTILFFFFFSASFLICVLACLPHFFFVGWNMHQMLGSVKVQWSFFLLFSFFSNLYGSAFRSDNSGLERILISQFHCAFFAA